MKVVNLERAFASFDEPWSPRILAQMNEVYIKAAKVEGEFVWHRHDDTDEAFLVTRGRLTIRFRDRDVVLARVTCSWSQRGGASVGRGRADRDPPHRARRHRQYRRCRRPGLDHGSLYLAPCRRRSRVRLMRTCSGRPPATGSRSPTPT